jgi:hypothetical protein
LSDPWFHLYLKRPEHSPVYGRGGRRKRKQRAKRARVMRRWLDMAAARIAEVWTPPNPSWRLLQRAWTDVLVFGRPVDEAVAEVVAKAVAGHI